MTKPSRESIAETLVLAAVRLPRVLRGLDKSPALTSTEASALAVLVHGGSMNIGNLARLEQVTAPSMSRTVSNLERRGLVERITDPEDARGWIVQVTQQGRTLFVQGHERKLAPLLNWLDDLSEEDLGKLMAALPILEAMGELRAPADQ